MAMSSEEARQQTEYALKVGCTVIVVLLVSGLVAFFGVVRFVRWAWYW